MIIQFVDAALRDLCNNQERLVRRYGRQRAQLARQRLDELFNADALADLRRLPHVEVRVVEDEPLVLALDLGDPYHLRFRAAGRDGRNNAGTRDWKKINSILILGIQRANEEKKP